MENDLKFKRFINSIFYIAIFYFIVYFVYSIIFVDYTNELNHWITLVSIPFLIVIFTLKQTTLDFKFSYVFKAFRIEKEGLLKKILWGLLFGLIMGSIQIMLSRKSGQIIEIISDGSFFYKFPIALAMMLITAGFTEEFFFRGFIQTSLQRKLKSNFWAVIIASFLFGIYHFPYAYYNESWPSHGNFWAAIQEGVTFAFIAGLIIGGCYAKFKNLVVPVIIHAMINAVWFSTTLKINF